jgi:trimeric autotransporter adhesin
MTSRARNHRRPKQLKKKDKLMKNRFKIFTILSALACLGLAFGERALANPETGPAANAAGDAQDGFAALGNASPGLFLSAFGWESQVFAPSFGTASLGNTSVGAASLVGSGGSFHTAVGAGALLLNFAANDNTALGFEAMLFNDFTANGLGADNTAVGFQALLNNIDAAANTAVGSGALFNNDISGFALAGGNTAVGFDALFTNGDGGANTAVGSGALFLNDGFNRSTAVGFNAGLFSTADEMTAVGAFALGLGFNVGTHNTAVGFDALAFNGTGFNNTAMGHSALEFNTSGDDNTAVGWQALLNEDIGANQTAVGSNALLSSLGSLGSFDNTAVGRGALETLNAGNRNAVLGDLAGEFITSGSSNVLVGPDIGANLVTGSGNVYIGDTVSGPTDEFGFIRIQDSNTPIAGTTSKVMIGGISGATVGAGALLVRVNAAGQLGTAVSSARFKTDIKSMDKSSEAIFSLRPVTYRLKGDETNTPNWGLIAEEVAKVNPDLIVKDAKGEILTVRDEQINFMLLNEFLKEHKKVEAQQATISELKNEVQTVVAQLKEQAAQIQKVSAQLEVSKPAPQVVVNKP